MIDDKEIIHSVKLVLVALLGILVVSIAPARPLTRAEIGELFIFGVPDHKISKALETHLRWTCPGSILLFRRNLTSNQQAFQFVERLKSLRRSCSASPLFVGLDQEGGIVSRLIFDPPQPSPLAVGLANNAELAENLGREVGAALRSLGFNLNFAPVLDLGKLDRRSFIGTRSFGENPELVGRIGSAYAFGLLSAGILPVAKHFPA